MYNSVEARALFLNDSMVEAALQNRLKRYAAKDLKASFDLCVNRDSPTKDWNDPKSGFGWKTTDCKIYSKPITNIFARKPASME